MTMSMHVAGPTRDLGITSKRQEFILDAIASGIEPTEAIVLDQRIVESAALVQQLMNDGMWSEADAQAERDEAAITARWGTAFPRHPHQ